MSSAAETACVADKVTYEAAAVPMTVTSHAALRTSPQGTQHDLLGRFPSDVRTHVCSVTDCR